MNLYRLLGVLVALYTLYAVNTGEVYARSGLWARRILKSESPVYFWIVIVIYAGLSAAMMTVF